MGHAGHDEEKRRARLERMPRVTEKYLKCVPVWQIAEAEGVTTRVIYGDLQAARRIWMQRASTNIKKVVARELAKLDTIEREAWECHEMQKAKILAKRQKKVTQPDGKQETSQEVLKKSPMLKSVWLETVLNCMERRAKLLRLEEGDQGQAGVLQAAIIEVVVENPDQVARIMHYNDFDKLTHQTIDAEAAEAIAVSEGE